MFNRRVILLTILSFLCWGLLIWNWQLPLGVALPGDEEVIRPEGLGSDLNGKWQSFASLRGAWSNLNNVGKTNTIDEKSKFTSFISSETKLFLPSSQTFKVAAKTFSIPQAWSSRNLRLTLYGVKGEVNVFLNGIDPLHRLTVFDGNGGNYSVLIPPTAFRYGEKNILLLEGARGEFQQRYLFTLGGPVATVSGGVRIDAVQANLSLPRLTFEGAAQGATVKVQTVVSQPSLINSGGWRLEGLLSDGSAAIGVSTATIKNTPENQDLELFYRIPALKLWNPSSPELYHFRLTTDGAQGEADSMAFVTGFRQISFNEGFWLNGRSLRIKGLSLSQEASFDILSSGKVYEWLQSIKGKGYNLVYFTGIPEGTWLRAADKLGLGIWVELPVSFTASQQLPSPQSFSNLAASFSRHPSLWAITIGKGLDPINSAQLEKYWRECTDQFGTIPLFVLQPPLHNLINGSEGASDVPFIKLTIEDNKLSGLWGSIEPAQESISSLPRRSWWGEEGLAGGLALFSLLVFLMNLRTVNWRYKELSIEKPKRPLRQAWFWNGIHFVTREGIIAGLLLALLFNSQLDKWFFFSATMPILKELMLQSPWLLWLGLTSLLIMVRILQVGVVAPFLPGSPNPLGLIYWLERRFLWLPLVVLAWAILPYTIFPSWIAPLSYLVLSLLSWLIRLRDVHKAGGKYKGFLVVPLILGLIPIVMGYFRGADIFFLWHWFLILFIR